METSGNVIPELENKRQKTWGGTWNILSGVAHALSLAVSIPCLPLAIPILKPISWGTCGANSMTSMSWLLNPYKIFLLFNEPTPSAEVVIGLDIIGLKTVLLHSGMK